MARSELTEIGGPDRQEQIDRLCAENQRIGEAVARVRLRSRSYRRPSMTPVGKAVLLGTATWLFLAQWTLYPGTVDGENTGMRDLGIGIVLVLAASGLETTLPRAPLLGVCALCGLALVACGIVLPHGHTVNQVSELVSGGATLLGVALGATRTR